MKTSFVLLTASAVMMSALVVPTANANHPVCDDRSICVGNSGYCDDRSICVLNSGYCDDASICVLNGGTCDDASVCVLQYYNTIIATAGSVSGITPRGGCDSASVISLSQVSGTWSFNQYFVNTGASGGCGAGGLGVSQWRAYTSEDSAFTSGEDSVTITRATSSQLGKPSFERTTLTFVDGGIHFSQLFTDYEGRPTWQANGFFAHVDGSYSPVQIHV